MNYWQDKVVVITGGSSGLGFAFAHELLARGSKVAVVARDPSRLQQAEVALNCPDRLLCLTANLTHSTEVQALPSSVLERFGRVDALVNCAGRSSRGEVLKTPLDTYRELFELNTMALISCTQAFAASLSSTGGHVVNIGSLASKLASRFLGAYPVSKFPVGAFSQQLRLEAQGAFHVLLVCPGPIARDDAGRRYQDSEVPEVAKQPGGGAKLKGLDPYFVVASTLRACQRRRRELILPRKARILVAISAMHPAWGDWLLRKFSS